MRLAFVSFHYFPYGGLTRDMRAMAELCQERGHDVVIYVGTWHGERLQHLKAETLVNHRTWSNPSHNSAFIAALQQKLAQEPDRVVIGFNKMPGLDFYYAADTCFAAKADQRGGLFRSTRRARQYLAHEEAVFSPRSRTHSFMISRREMAVFRRYYDTPLDRLHVLPPGIRRDRVLPEDEAEWRAGLRERYGLAADQKLVLMVGSNFKLKGLDRAIRGFAALPADFARKTVLWVAGQGRAAPFERLARKLKVDGQVRILGVRDDVAELLWIADAFLHPAYRENTGTVILEAMVAGLPVVVTDVCGYADYVTAHRLGQVLSGDVSGADVATALVNVLSKPRDQWVARSREFAREDIYSMTERAAELIETLSGDLP